ncbi:MAG: hypothetical protein U5R30_07665 [Deltaproteobacteria bacterium]|nr:hypothetical protein [Deltaproteobacteria bacterium]
MKPLTYRVLVTATAALLLACSVADRPKDTADVRSRIAGSYGIDSFGQVDEMRYTFNVKLGDKQISRSWTWWPEDDRVEFRPDGDQTKAVRYSRTSLSAGASEELKKIDAAFINDQYWLLFPFHLVWDRQTSVVDVGRRPLPIGSDSAHSVVVTYPPSGGYTPGDVYELFIAPDNRLVQWIYRKGGSLEPTRVATWQDHRKVGPLTLALDHHGPNADFRVWFTDVAVRLKGSDRWYEAS